MSKLAKYRGKRNFDHSAEPAGGSPRARQRAGGRFIIHKHDASNLHYDLRLEVHGVLRSWAVPKGPSLKPGEKRLAVAVEDHPLEYADFEGVIPEDEYGGGTVMLWDGGEWSPGQKRSSDRLDIHLRGERLRGKWTLTRMRSDDNKDNWLLIKRHDDEDEKNKSPASGLDEDTSVASGRSMAEIAADRDNEWASSKTAMTSNDTPAPQSSTAR